MDQNAGGGGPPLMRWNGQEGKYLKCDSDMEFNDGCFVLNPAGAVAGYLKFGGKGEAPERHTGPIYPKDEAPERASLGDTDQSKWSVGRFWRGEGLVLAAPQGAAWVAWSKLPDDHLDKETWDWNANRAFFEQPQFEGLLGAESL
jgi:hypothetical protein